MGGVVLSHGICWNLLHCNRKRIHLPLFSHSVMSSSFSTPWTIAHQAPLSMGFLRQEYWSGLPFSSPTSALRLMIISSHFSCLKFSEVNSFPCVLETFQSGTIVYQWTPLFTVLITVLHKYLLETPGFSLNLNPTPSLYFPLPSCLHHSPMM